MNTPETPFNASFLNRLRLFIIVVLLVLLFIPMTHPQQLQRVQAEGSLDMFPNGTAGNRAFLDGNDSTIGDIERNNLISIYAAVGEQIEVASSALGIGSGAIEYTDPNGNTTTITTPGSAACDIGDPNSGFIPDRAAEVAGPGVGFTPCTIDVTIEGIWQVEFVAPDPNRDRDPSPVAADVDWNTPTTNDTFLAAWDVTVRDQTSGNIQNGRAFAHYLPLNLGAYDVPFNSQFYILTNDGALYQWSMNNMEPFVVIFFANNKGFRDASGEPIYRSLQFINGGSSNPYGDMPPGFSVHDPHKPDTAEDVTHKIFFQEPDSTMPATTNVAARDADGNLLGPGNTTTTWLNPTFEDPDPPQNFRFVGKEDTTSQAGTTLGGIFKFDSTGAAKRYTIRIDTNQDNIFGCEPPGAAADCDKDRVLTGKIDQPAPGASIVHMEVPWDGNDANGDPVPASQIAYNATIEFRAGEVHFPILDPETNSDGIIIERLRPTSRGSYDNVYNIYYNDDYKYTQEDKDNGEPYDYSLCADGDTPTPEYPSQTAKCYGTHDDPRNASVSGIPSDGGAHRWDSHTTAKTDGFGNFRGINTWTYVPSPPVELEERISIKEADLQIEKTGSIVGSTIFYELVVTNNGPSDVQGATVIDILPTDIADATWECAITSGSGNCDETSGSGDINTTVDLNDQAVATFTIQGRLTTDGTLDNTAQVERPNDVFDPNPNNNESTETLIVPPQADLSITKVVNVSEVTVGDDLIFTIEVTNNGPNDATGVQLQDELPAGLAFLFATPSQGTYDSVTGTWDVGSLSNGSSATLAILTRVDTSMTGTNRAQVSASDQPDFDSTPNNMGTTPQEDDEASATFTANEPKTADLELRKSVQPTAVVVGSTVTFRILLVNNGPDEATNVQVQDQLPSGLDYISASTNQGSYNPANGIWDAGTVATGANLYLDITAQVRGSTNQVNTAEISASDQRDPDSTPGNNDPDEDDQDSARIQVEQSADLSLSKTVVRAPTRVGDNVVFLIRVENAGPNSAPDVEVQDQLPAGLTYVSHTASQGTYTPATGRWSIGTIANDEAVTLLLTTRLDTPDGTTNVAEVTASNLRDPDSTPGNNDPNEDDLDRATVFPVAAVDAFKRDSLVEDRDGNGTPSAGDILQYEIVIENNSSVTANDIRFTDVPDINTSLVDGSVESSQGTVTRGNTTGDTDVAVDVGDIRPDQQVIITFRVKIANPLPAGVTQVANQGVVSGSNVTAKLTDDPDTPEAGDPTITPITSEPVIDAFKRDTFNTALNDNDGDGVPSPGDTLQYEIIIINTGNAPARDLTFTDTPDPHTSLVDGSVETSQGTIDSGNGAGDTTVMIELGTVGAGEQVTISFDVRIANPLPAGVIEIANQGLVTGANVPSTPTDDPDTPVDDDPTRTPVTQQPRLQAFKQDALVDDNDNNGIPSPGDTLVYVIYLMNTGNSAASDVVFSDIPDINTTLVPGSVKTDLGIVLTGNAPGDTTIEVEVGTIQPRAIISISYAVAIDNPLSSLVQRLENQGIATGPDIPSVPTDDPDTILEDDPTGTPLTREPIIDASKRSSLLIDRDGDGTTSAGDTLVYTVKLQNIGNISASGIVFEDQPDRYTTLVPASVHTDHGTVTSGNASGDSTIVVEAGTIPVGGVVTISYQVTIANSLPERITQIANQGIVTGSDMPRTPTYDPINPDRNRHTITLLKQVSRIDASKTDVPVTDTNSDGLVSSGDTLMYAITLRNRGDKAITGIVFTDPIEENLTLVSGSVKTDQGTVVRGNAAGDTGVEIDIGTIPAQGSVRISFEVQVNAILRDNTTELLNQGIVTTDDPNGGTTLTDDPDKPGDSDVTTTPLTAIDIIKQVEPQRVVPNQPVTYRLIVRNIGRDIDFSPVTVSDDLPPGLTYIPGSSAPTEPQIRDGRLVWSDITQGERFKPGETIEITFRAQASESGTIVNTAVVTADHPGGTTTDSDDTDLFVVDPGVEIEKFAVTPNFVNGLITFTIRITNTGASTLDVVPLTDSYSGPIEYVGGTVAPDSIDSDAQVLTWNDLTETFGNMRVGDVYTIDTVFRLTEEVPEGRTEIRNTAIVRDATDTFGNIAPPTEDGETVTSSTPTAIQLLSFTANHRGEAIQLRWVTGLELNTWGFHLWRSSGDGREHAERVTTTMLPARGNGSTGASYTWNDAYVEEGVTYTYWLQEIELDGTTIDYGPVTPSATIQGQNSVFLPVIQR